MAFYDTTAACRRREKTDLPSKNRVGDFSAIPAHRARRFAPQPLAAHRKNSPTPTKTASGLTCWLIRDPIGEAGWMLLASVVAEHSTIAAPSITSRVTKSGVLAIEDLMKTLRNHARFHEIQQRQSAQNPLFRVFQGLDRDSTLALGPAYPFVSNDPIRRYDSLGLLTLVDVAILEGTLAVVYATSGLLICGTLCDGLQPGEQMYAPVVNIFGQEAQWGDYYIKIFAYKYERIRGYDQKKAKWVYKCKCICDIAAVPQSFGSGFLNPGPPNRLVDIVNPPST